MEDLAGVGAFYEGAVRVVCQVCFAVHGPGGTGVDGVDQLRGGPIRHRVGGAEQKRLVVDALRLPTAQVAAMGAAMKKLCEKRRAR